MHSADEGTILQRLAFWQAVEYLQAPELPDFKTQSPEERYARLGAGDAAPWEEATRRAWGMEETPTHTWRHTIYLGVFSVCAILEQLQALFGADEAAEELPAEGDTCLAAVTVDAQGRPLPDTFVIASVGWALGRLKEAAGEVGNNGWLQEFDAFQETQQEEFLTPDGRLDLNQDPGRRARLLAPARFPAGRWPSPGHHPLVLGQQAAVNGTWETLRAGRGLVSVNGPPGTGKTTLLRDLIAAVVVERAERLAALRHPGEAFAGKSSINIGGATTSVWRLHEDWTEYGIVVASSNNGAVENVTKELPGVNTISFARRGPPALGGGGIRVLQG